MATKQFKVPFNSKGDLMSYAMDEYHYDPVTKTSTRIPPTWRDNEPFQADLTLKGTERGRSAAHFIWNDQHGHRYSMFLTDMLELSQQGTIDKGSVTGQTWIIRKRGQNYGIGLY